MMKKTLLFVLTFMMSISTWALDLDTAKEKKLVGEGMKGYLNLIEIKNAEAAILVTEINRKRKSKYQAIANKQKTALGNIEQIAGEKLTAKAKAKGQAYQDTSGQWVK